MKEELRRDMILLGCKNIKELNSSKIAYRWCNLGVWKLLKIWIGF
jgi:isopentenyl diphosphate isomerase/L-lactate dehydrogenase-like FMN-dependent dehydrogenase